MDIVYVLIGFVCGFICREVLLRKQVTRMRAELDVWLKQQQLEERKHGDN